MISTHCSLESGKEHLSRYGICERSEGGHLDGQNIKKWFIEVRFYSVCEIIIQKNVHFDNFDKSYDLEGTIKQ